MESNNGWNATNDVDFSYDSTHCTNNLCTRPRASNGDSWIDKSTNITSYYSIQLQIDINTYDLENGDFCQVWYKYDNDPWTNYNDYSDDIINATINFPVKHSSNTLWIRLEAHGDSSSGGDRCYFDNAILRGSLPTEQPTMEPTTEPTAYEPTQPTLEPTFNPTSHPTMEPTTNQPTSYTLTPTINPTGYNEFCFIQ